MNEKILAVCLITPINIDVHPDYYCEEFKNLLESNGIRDNVVFYFSKLRSIDAAYFLTKGKLEEIKQICDDQEIDKVILSESISPHQEYMLSKYLRTRVFDRTQLILEIFERGAVSGEGKLQVEIAFLKFKKTRVAGKGINLSQQSGRIGGKGPGETLKENELQHLDQLMHRLKKELKQLEQTRATQRKQRLKSKIPLISLIGYTNSGKSSLLNLLTNSDIYVENKLFATLDTTTRELFINAKKAALISDTVGFIQKLPHTLIEAFKSTLHELEFSDLLIHLVDISNPDFRNHIDVVNEVLTELGIENKKQLLVFNKIDLLSEEKIALLNLDNNYKDYIVISTKEKINVDLLKNKIIENI